MPNCIAPPFLKRRFLFLGCSRLGPLFRHLWREIRPEGTLFSAAQACGPARAPAASANALAASDFSHRLGRSGLDLTYL
jgi:hypothetical protein